MKMRTALTALAALMTISGAAFSGAAWAKSGETTITGVVSKVDPAMRIATITPATGAPVVVQFQWNVGGPCDACLGGGRTGDLFEKTITEGSTWTITYTTSIPEGTAAWFPGGTVHTVYNARKPGDNAPEPPRPGQGRAAAPEGEGQ